MAIAVVAERENTAERTVTLELCPFNADGECRCERDADGNPTPGHPLYHFGAEPPPDAPDPDAYPAWRRQHAVDLETVGRGGAPPPLPERAEAAEPEPEPAAQPPDTHTRGGAIGPADQLEESASPQPSQLTAEQAAPEDEEAR